MINLKTRLISLRRSLRRTLSGPPALAFLPAAILAAFWLGGEGWLLAMALGMPILFSALGLFDGAGRGMDPDHPKTLIPTLDRVLQSAANSGRKTACLALQLDDVDDLLSRYGSANMVRINARVLERLDTALRDADTVFQTENGHYVVVLAPMRQLDLESAIQLAARLQSCVEDPVSLDAQTVYLSCSIGFTLQGQIPQATASTLLAATKSALDLATTNGPSAIRAYGPEMPAVPSTGEIDADETAKALETGQIKPWFQPQISTDTGEITGVEALARWHHPQRGMIPPAEFLPVMQRAGQLERLGEVILFHSLTALRDWDKRALGIPGVAVNFAGEELRNPKLIDKIRWELDRFDLPADRLCIEVLETVVAASADDIVARNINGLAKLGCKIDLDDFGTGHASISSIRRFAVQRLKIDRSFVMKVDRDPEQQRMVAAILTMAERLGLEALAEGVETAGEHAMLAQLGCGHVQGFGIGRPMPAEQMSDWLRTHRAKLLCTPQIGRSTG